MEFADLDSKMIHVGHLVYPISDTIMQRKPSRSYESEARLPVNLEYQMTWSNSGQRFYAFVAGKPFPGKVTATCFWVAESQRHLFRLDPNLEVFKHKSSSLTMFSMHVTLVITSNYYINDQTLIKKKNRVGKISLLSSANHLGSGLVSALVGTVNKQLLYGCMQAPFCIYILLMVTGSTSGSTVKSHVKMCN